MRTHHPAIKSVTFTPTGQTAVDLEAIRSAANNQRMDFMRNTIALDQRQLLTQIETLGECMNEEEDSAGREVTKRCMDLVAAIGLFKFPNTWAEAHRAHFQGEVVS